MKHVWPLFLILVLASSGGCAGVFMYDISISKEQGEGKETYANSVLASCLWLLPQSV